MPTDMFLDGELWLVFPPPPLPCIVMLLIDLPFSRRFGHNNFQEALKMANKAKVDWTKLKYMIFDIPTMQGKPYSERYQTLGKCSTYSFR